MDNLLKTLGEKKEAHRLLMLQAMELEKQIKTLEDTIKIVHPTDFERYLAQISKGKEKMQTSPILSVVETIDGNESRAIKLHPAGTKKQLLLKCLYSGEKSFAEILEFFKAHDYILSTNTLRATMGQYKEKNVIAAGHKNGFYKLTEDAQKQYEISEGGF